MMDWTELTITVPRAQAAAAEAAATALADGGLYIEDYADLEEMVQAIAHVDLIEQALLDQPRDRVRIHLYISPDENAAAAAEKLSATLLAAGVAPTLERGTVHQQDWEHAWKQYYHTLEIGERLAVVPSWEAYTGPRTALRLDPGMAFGTGTHETTALCLEVLDKAIEGGEAVLDVGTGSGILAVAALLLGAKSALGIDIDPMAVRTAGENAARNGVEGRMEIVAGDLASGAPGRYDIITVNIVADAIIRLAPDVPGKLAPGGLFVASGIIDERAAQVAAALEGAGLAVARTLVKNGWVALVARAASA